MAIDKGSLVMPLPITSHWLSVIAVVLAADSDGGTTAYSASPLAESDRQ